MTAKDSVQVSLKNYIHGVNPPQNYVPPQVHSCYELIFYASGNGKTLIGEDLYDFNAGDMAIIQPETVHDELCNTASEVYCCLFTYEGDLPLGNGLYPICRTEESQETVNDLVALFQRIEHELLQKQMAYEAVVDLLMGQLLVLVCRTHSRIRSASEGVDYVKTYIKENYARRLDFHILANQVGYSYDRLRHIFKERVGVSPSRYLLNVRIRRAKELLVSTNHSIEYVAKATGFGGASRFVEVFRLEIGQTPGGYRKANQGKDITRIL